MILNSNYDGFGMMWVEDGRVKRLVSMGTTDEKIDLYKENMNKGDLAIHVRHATMGEKNEANCHPYRILSKDEGDKIDAYLMHNGTIHNVQVDREFSDSWNFANYFLRPFLKGRNEVITDKNFLYLLTGMIGDNNKLVILDSKSRWHIVNSLAGTYQQGCWVSTKTELRPLVKQAFPSLGPHTPTNKSQNSIHSSAGVRHPVNQGDWATDADGRSHFVVNQNAHRGAGGSENSSGSDDDAEGHTRRTEREDTGRVGAQSAKENDSQNQNTRTGQVLLPLAGGDGPIGRGMEAVLTDKSTPNGAWEPPKAIDPRNTSPWGQVAYNPEEISTLSKEEIIQLVLSAPMEITDYIWETTKELLSIRRS